MRESTTVTVGLDVHARSIRLAVRADELLAERTLPSDEEKVERLLRRWPAVRCCYEAGPTGFGLYRHLVGAGSTARSSRRGWCRSGRATASRPIRGMRASWRVCSPAGVWSRSTFRRRSWKLPVISYARVRTLVLIGCATGTGSRSSVCVTGGFCRPAAGPSCGASGSASSASSTRPSRSPSTATCIRSTSSTRGSSKLERAIRETSEQEPWRGVVGQLRCLRGIDTLTALGLVSGLLAPGTRAATADCRYRLDVEAARARVPAIHLDAQCLKSHDKSAQSQFGPKATTALANVR
jgi:hypothetical protein